MGTYRIRTLVSYDYEVEADSEEQAEELGWSYEDYPYSASVEEITVEEIEEEEE